MINGRHDIVHCHFHCPGTIAVINFLQVEQWKIISFPHDYFLSAVISNQLLLLRKTEDVTLALLMNLIVEEQTTILDIRTGVHGRVIAYE